MKLKLYPFFPINLFAVYSSGHKPLDFQISKKKFPWPRPHFNYFIYQIEFILSFHLQTWCFNFYCCMCAFSVQMCVLFCILLYLIPTYIRILRTYNHIVYICTCMCIYVYTCILSFLFLWINFGGLDVLSSLSQSSFCLHPTLAQQETGVEGDFWTTHMLSLS